MNCLCLPVGALEFIMSLRFGYLALAPKPPPPMFWSKKEDLLGWPEGAGLLPNPDAMSSGADAGLLPKPEARFGGAAGLGWLPNPPAKFAAAGLPPNAPNFGGAGLLPNPDANPGGAPSTAGPKLFNNC